MRTNLKKKKIQAGEISQRCVDRISDLPEDVMNLILTCLPIRDAVRTSILSKKWRYKWVVIPDIVFDKDYLKKGSSETERAIAVDEVLFRHVGPICKFSCMFYTLSSSHIDSWVAFLRWNGIKNLILLMEWATPRTGQRYFDVPCSLFYCQELCHLELSHCNLKVPPSFKGFRNLLVLNLVVTMSADDISCLISKCPRLESLKLRTGGHHQRIDIHAPNLRYLELIGNIRDLSLGSTPLLTDASILFYVPPDYWAWRDCKQGITCSLIEFFGRLNRIERLAIKGSFLQFFSIRGIPKMLSSTNDHLKYLEVEINLHSKDSVAALCILRSSPNLKKLKIYYTFSEDDPREEEAEFLAAETQFDILLSHLQIVEIIGLTKLFNLEFIRYILSSAPVLETMNIYTDPHVEDEEVSRILKELVRFRRASTRAEISYLGRYEGEELYGGLFVNYFSLSLPGSLPNG